MRGLSWFELVWAALLWSEFVVGVSTEAPLYVYSMHVSHRAFVQNLEDRRNTGWSVATASQ